MKRHGGGPHHVLGRAAGLLIALAALLASLVHASEWRPMFDTPDGIQIFKKDATESGLIEFRGIGIVDAPLPVVATVIFDAERRVQWIKGLAESLILRWDGKDSFIEFNRIDMPTFFKDRDFISKVLIRSDHARREVVFQFQPADDPSAPATGHLRGEVINMTFALRSIDRDTRTRVDAEFLCDPKGWIPAWLVNFFLRDWPKTTFRGLRQEVLKPDIAVDPRFAELLGP
jgi:hypothetical protein